MDAQLGIAGLACVALAFGHMTLGVVWVLPGTTAERLPRTPFGPPATTVAMVRVTWHVVTVFALGIGGVLTTLAVSPGADPRVVVLRWFAAVWLGAVLVAALVVRPRRPRDLVGLPVPLVWLVVAALCWAAST